MRLTDVFIASAACPPELKNSNSIATELGSLAIVDTIKNLTGDIYHLSDSLKGQINKFQKRFSPNNTFKVTLNFDSTAGYRRYADSLEDFVANDKITEYQYISSNLYRDILSRVGKNLQQVSSFRRLYFGDFDLAAISIFLSQLTT